MLDLADVLAEQPDSVIDICRGWLLAHRAPSTTAALDRLDRARAGQRGDGAGDAALRRALLRFERRDHDAAVERLRTGYIGAHIGTLGMRCVLDTLADELSLASGYLDGVAEMALDGPLDADERDRIDAETVTMLHEASLRDDDEPALRVTFVRPDENDAA